MLNFYVPLWNGGNKGTCFIELLWGLKWHNSGHSLINSLSKFGVPWEQWQMWEVIRFWMYFVGRANSFADELVGCGMWEKKESSTTLRLLAWASWQDGAATYWAGGDVGGVGLRARSKSWVSDIQVEIWGRQLEKSSLEFREEVQAKAMDLRVISNRWYLKSWIRWDH